MTWGRTGKGDETPFAEIPFVEFGHRRVLVGLVRRIRPDVQAINLGDPADLPDLLAMADPAA